MSGAISKGSPVRRCDTSAAEAIFELDTSPLAQPLVLRDSPHEPPPASRGS